jgi:hypothetical protein
MGLDIRPPVASSFAACPGAPFPNDCWSGAWWCRNCPCGLFLPAVQPELATPGELLFQCALVAGGYALAKRLMQEDEASCGVLRGGFGVQTVRMV